MRTNLVRLWFFLCVILVGCVEGPHPRLNALFGTQIYQHQQPDPVWPQLQRIGLVVHSDPTGPGAAPAISPAFLETLSRRTEEFLMQQCGVSSVVPIALPSSTQPAQLQQELISRGQEHGISHLLLVILSSREYSGPVTLGEERMMTQISGTTFENMALAEVVLLDLADYAVTFDLAGAATETLEVLDVPIGEGRTSRAESLDILRAQAGQQALDRSLNILRKRCHGVREKTAFMDVTGNFQTGDPAQNPALST
ncbi:MAG: hypothetical protein V3T42_01375 [Nitrospirales bacterium]